jgi:hypothetical protein
MPELHSVQTWMLAAMTAPDAPEREEAGAMVRSTPSLGAAERIALYRRGYRARLVECMRATHPALRHVLGDELFDSFALDYLAASPSRSYTLTELGAGFPDHLEATRPEGDELWPEFVVDLARLERAFHEVYEGEGTEGEEPPGHGAVLEPAPCLRLLRSRFPVGDYLLAARRGEAPELPPPRDTWIALARRDYVVTVTELDEPGHAVLEALLAGASAEQAAQAADLASEEMRLRMRDWAGRGFFRAVRPDNQREPSR